MSLEFRKIKKQARLLDPRNNYQELAVETEIRFHPLNQRTSRICHSHTRQGFPRRDLDALAVATRDTCPFCAEKIETITPKFPADLIPEGRVKVGETTIVPNLSPYDQHSAVAVITREHYVPLLELSSQQLMDAFAAAFQYFERCTKNDGEAEYPLVNWNYMPYAGGSIVHTHLQVYATSTPGNFHADLIDSSRNYFARHGRNFWDDYLAEEIRLNERYIARLGTIDWLMSFTPLGTAGDILFMFPKRASSWDLTSQDRWDLVQGLQRLFRYFDSVNLQSFNMAIYPGPRGQEYFWTHGLISPRITLNPATHACDVNSLRHLYNEPFCNLWPEKQRDDIQPFFQ